MSGFFDWLKALSGRFPNDELPVLAYKKDVPATAREVAFAYLFGDCVEQDYAQALKWYGRSERDNYFFVGACHYKLKNYSAAVRYFKKEIARKAYGSQMSMAARALAECYRNGIGTKPNSKRSQQYAMLEGNAGGTARDTYWSGICSLLGLGVREDVAEGLRLLELAAHEGEDWAWMRLGKIYLRGEFSVARDVEKAMEYIGRTHRQPELAAYYMREAQNAKKP